MKLKRFQPAAKKGMNTAKPGNKDVKGPVGLGDPQTKKGATAPRPTGSVGMFYEPDKSFTPDTTKVKPKRKANPATKKTTIGRSAASTKMAKKSKKKDVNNGIRG